MPNRGFEPAGTVTNKETRQMAFSTQNSKGTTYFLHAKDVTLRGGRQQRLFYFAKAAGAGALDAVPTGYMVAESKNGLPVLKKKA